MTTVIDGTEYQADSFESLLKIMDDLGVDKVEVQHEFFGNEAFKGTLTRQDVEKLATEIKAENIVNFNNLIGGKNMDIEKSIINGAEHVLDGVGEGAKTIGGAVTASGSSPAEKNFNATMQLLKGAGELAIGGAKSLLKDVGGTIDL